MILSPDDFGNLSIVIQGPAELCGHPVAAIAAQSARRAFPGAEVIVSCWDTDRIETVHTLADRLVRSQDPGPQRHSGGILNVNRQNISSYAGSNAATRPYVLKARSDLVFRSSRLWSEYLNHQKYFRSAKERDPILITNLTSINPRRQERYFALCDWIYLGPHDLMAQLLATPFFPKENLAYEIGDHSVLRYNAEQWIAANYLARHGLDLKIFTDGYVTGPALAKAHREHVGQHFAMSSWFRLGLSSQKHRISSFSLNNMYTHREWAKEFLGRYSLWDPERIAISTAYHPLVRATAKCMKRTHIE